VERLVADPEAISEVVAFDLPRLGRLDGLDVVHLQCHIGTDTVSLARLGARAVTGLDVSPASLAEAAAIAVRCGADIRWVESDVYLAPEALGATYDVVYTGIGALNWLPSVDRWARVVAALLRPGGRLFIRDGHPMLYALPDLEHYDDLRVELPYFEVVEPLVGEWTGTYVQTDEAPQPSTSMEWNHGIGDLLTAVLANGLRITGFEEHTSAPWDALPGLTREIPGGEYELADRPERLAFTFTLQAVKD
jgi:SAM-dependent methyltransferase